MPSLSRFAVAALVALSLLGARARAQAVPQGSPTEHVDSGAVLRVTTRDGAVVQGPLVTWSALGVTLAGRERDGTSPSSLRFSDVQAVEVRSVSRRTGQGALTGFAAAVVFGLVETVGCFSTYGDRRENFCGLGFVVTPILGVIGAVAGAGIGAMLHAESWQHVPLAPR
ncbi:hypothetical protein BH11GEM2_BH11GEM2_04610 [soil metagenome]